MLATLTVRCVRLRAGSTRLLYGVAIICLLAMVQPLRATAVTSCSQDDTAQLSETARAILNANQLLSGATALNSSRSSLAAAVRLQPQRELLQTRAELLRSLMQSDPGQVRSVMLPTAVAARLLLADPANDAYIEHEASSSGDLRALEVDDFQDNSGARVYTLHVPSAASNLSLHPLSGSNLQGLLHRSVTVTGVQLGTDLLAETVEPALPDLTRTNLSSAPGSITLHAAAVVPASNASLTCSTTGQQRTAVLLLQFPNNTPAFPGSYGTAAWWQQAITGSDHSVNALWAEMTAGGTYATVDVYGPITLSQSYGCADYMALRSAALTSASNTIDLSRYTRIVLGFPASSCSFGGLANIGCNGADTLIPHPYSVVWMPIVTTYTMTTGVWASLSHELGHNLGLNHANTLDFGTVSLGPIDFQETNPGVVNGTGSSTAAGTVTAIDTEYGDVFSVMGNPWSTLR